jgi:hypothetical protein
VVLTRETAGLPQAEEEAADDSASAGPLPATTLAANSDAPTSMTADRLDARLKDPMSPPNLP